MDFIHGVFWLGAGFAFLLALGALLAAPREPGRRRRIGLLLLAASALLGASKITLSLTMKLPPAIAWSLTGLWWACMIATWVAFRRIRSGP